jgi:ATP-dependent DNA helicase RecQ
VVFSDVSLRHMARCYPTDAAALLDIPGVGEKKLADFGKPFMDAIAAWLLENPRQNFAALRPAAAPTRKMQSEGALNGTTLATLERFRAGVPVEDIAKERSLAITTIEGHLARAVESGEKFDPRAFYSQTEELAMREALVGHEGPALSPIYEKLGGHISYGKLRLFLAFKTAALAAASGG